MCSLLALAMYGGVSPEAVAVILAGLVVVLTVSKRATSIVPALMVLLAPLLLAWQASGGDPEFFVRILSAVLTLGVMTLGLLIILRPFGRY